jgi:hypothetical protein
MDTPIIVALITGVAGVITGVAGPCILAVLNYHIQGRVKKQESELQKTKEDVEAIRSALRGILTKHEWGPLKGLGGSDEVRLPRHMPNLISYLHRLDALEYIQPNSGRTGLIDIENLSGDTRFDLRNYFHITDAGKTYLKITEYLGIFKRGAKWYDEHPYDDTPRT